MSNTTYTGTPYVYRLSWKSPEKYYVGSKFAEGCHPDSFWIDYFTSSEYVQEYRQEHGEPDSIEILAVFDDPDDAVTLERKILTEHDARNNPLFINKTNGCQKYSVHDPEIRKKQGRSLARTYKKRPELREAVSSNAKAYYQTRSKEEEVKHKRALQRNKIDFYKSTSEEWKAARAKAISENHCSKDPIKEAARREKLRAAAIQQNARLTDEERAERSKKVSGQVRARYASMTVEERKIKHAGESWKCEHCGKTGRGKGTYNRWHGDNCKSKK